MFGGRIGEQGRMNDVYIINLTTMVLHYVHVIIVSMCSCVIIMGIGNRSVI